MRINDYKNAALRTDLKLVSQDPSKVTYQKVLDGFEDETVKPERLCDIFAEASYLMHETDRLKKEIFYCKPASEEDYLGIREMNHEKREGFFERLHDPQTIRLIHAGLGMLSEACEFMDALGNYLFTGADLDEVNLAEELGDMNWYANGVGAYALSCLNPEMTLEEILRKNIAKLAKRYPEEFSGENALNRDLASERKILEGDKDV